jgi:thiol-disulfide isomerase/thioredoxin
MKKIIILAVITVLLTLSCTAQEKAKTEKNNIKWITNVEEAKDVAAKKNLPILVNFTGSDWCQWCFKLRDEVFVQEAFVKYAKENLVLLEADFPRKNNQSEETKKSYQQLASKFGVRGYPTILLMDANENEIARTGYQKGGAMIYISHLKDLLASNGSNANYFETKDFTLPDLKGNEVTLSKQSGVVILDFWATWCGPCKVEIPYLQALYEKYKTRGLTIIGISNEPIVTQMQFNALMNESGTNITYIQLVDEKAESFKNYGIQSIPATYIFAPNGTLLKKEVGFTPEMIPEFEKLIETALPK